MHGLRCGVHYDAAFTEGAAPGWERVGRGEHRKGEALPPSRSVDLAWGSTSILVVGDIADRARKRTTFFASTGLWLDSTRLQRHLHLLLVHAHSRQRNRFALRRQFFRLVAQLSLHLAGKPSPKASGEIPSARRDVGKDGDGRCREGGGGFGQALRSSGLAPQNAPPKISSLAFDAWCVFVCCVFFQCA